MKRTLQLVAGLMVLGLVSAVMAAKPMTFTATVANVSYKVLPSRQIVAAGAWQSNTLTYAQGSYCVVSGATLMAWTAVTSGATPPVIRAGTNLFNDAAGKWYRIPSGKRQGAVVGNEGSNAVVYVALGEGPAVVGGGLRLAYGGGMVVLDDVLQGEVFVTSPSNGVPISLQEW